MKIRELQKQRGRLGHTVVVIILLSSTQMPRHSQKVPRRSSPITKTFTRNGPIHPLRSHRRHQQKRTQLLCVQTPDMNPTGFPPKGLLAMSELLPPPADQEYESPSTTTNALE